MLGYVLQISKCKLKNKFGNNSHNLFLFFCFKFVLSGRVYAVFGNASFYSPVTHVNTMYLF